MHTTMNKFSRPLTILCAAAVMSTAACGSDQDTEATNSGASDSTFAATLGTAVPGYESPVDLSVRSVPRGEASTYVVEQGGTIRLVGTDGRPGSLAADLSSLTRERGERGLLGLAFSLDGGTAYVDYTDRRGRTQVDALDVAPDGTFDIGSRRNIYELDQPYPNHNGGDLIMSPDGASLFVFTGDGGAAGDPDRVALDPNSQLGKIVRIDLDPAGSFPSSVWAMGLRNPWRAYLDPTTQDLWIADVGQDTWEEIDVVPLARSEGVSFGWSAYEGTHSFNADQRDAHAAHPEIAPIYTYKHENDNCSISGGAVYRGSSIPVAGTWYVFADFCSGNVQALCVTPERTSCGISAVGRVDAPVAVLPDASGELWVVSHSGSLVPILPAA